MKLETILEAMECLNRAGTALSCGNLSVDEQVKLGGRCTGAWAAIKVALDRSNIDVPLKQAA